MASTSATAFARLLRRRLVNSHPLESRRCLSQGATNDEFSPEVVMSEKNREACVKKLRLSPRMKIDEKAKIAAVLVPLCSYKGELGLLYTLRSTKLNTDRGHVSFPGGMKDDTDESLVQTALRETWEELRIPESKVDVWTSANLIGKKRVSVMPVFGYVGEIDPEKLAINPEEVEEAFVISLRNLCEPKSFRFTQFRGSYRLPAYTGGKYRVWGFTAAITHMVMKALLPEVYRHELGQPLVECTSAAEKSHHQNP